MRVEANNQDDHAQLHDLKKQSNTSFVFRIIGPNRLMSYEVVTSRSRRLHASSANVSIGKPTAPLEEDDFIRCFSKFQQVKASSPKYPEK